MEDEQRGKPLRALARSHGLAAAPGGAPKGAPAVTQNSDPPGGKLVGSAPSASSRGSTRPGPLLSLAALALIDAVTGARHRLGVAYAHRPPLRDAGQSLRR